LAAGADTTVSAILTFFLAMICFPQVQMKAQGELDRVVSGRLPDFGDMEDLPYLSALVKEVLRLVFFAPADSMKMLTHRFWQVETGYTIR
jgi:cytochrome P450